MGKKRKKTTKEEPKLESSITWKVHPLKAKYGLATAVIVFVVFFLWQIQDMFKQLYLTVISGFILVGSLNPFFFGTRYEGTDEEIIIRRLFTTQRFPWTRFRKYYIEKAGVFISPYEKSNVMENFRGVFLSFEQEDREKVIGLVKNRLEAKP